MAETAFTAVAADPFLAVAAIPEGHKWLGYRPRACSVPRSVASVVQLECPCGATAGGRRRSVRSVVKRSYNGSARPRGRRALAITNVSYGAGTCLRPGAK